MPTSAQSKGYIISLSANQHSVPDTPDKEQSVQGYLQIRSPMSPGRCPGRPATFPGDRRRAMSIITGPVVCLSMETFKTNILVTRIPM